MSIADRIDDTLTAHRWTPCLDQGGSAADGAGTGRVDLRRVGRKTTITRLRACSPLKLLAPRRERQSAWVIASSFGGGLVSGDHIDLSVNLGPGATAYMGTQASTKVYRNDRGHGASQVMRATIDHEGLLVLAPDPVTCYRDAAYDQIQRFDLEGSASLVLLDWLTAGRIACGERWTMRRYRCQNDVYIDGHHVYADATLLTKTFGPIDAMFRVGPYNCLATMVVVGNRLEGITRQFVDAVEARPLGNRLPMISSVSTFDRGAVVRVASTSTSAVTGFLRDRIRQLAGVLGEDPWARKW